MAAHSSEKFGLWPRSEATSNSLQADLPGVEVSSWEEDASEVRHASIVLAQIGLVHYRPGEPVPRLLLQKGTGHVIWPVLISLPEPVSG